MGLVKCQFAIYFAEMEHQTQSKKGRLASIDEEDTFIEQTRDGHEGGSLEVSQQLGGMHGESAFDVYAPKVQRELVFTSVTEHYEAIHTQTQPKQSHLQFPFINLPKNEAITKKYSPCFCGKRLQQKHYLLIHLEQEHGRSFESLEYMRAYHYLLDNQLQSVIFRRYSQDYLLTIQKTACHLLRFPEELTAILPSHLRREIRHSLTVLLKLPSTSDYSYFERQLIQVTYRRTFYFSSDFMEGIRGMMNRYFTAFDRRAEMFLNNMCLKEMTMFLTFSLVNTFDSLADNPIKKKDQRRGLLFLGHLIEGMFLHFMAWVDNNYQLVFERHGAFSPIQVEEGETYSQVERLGHLKLLCDDYLQFMMLQETGSRDMQLVAFFMEYLQEFNTILKKGEPLIDFEPMKPRRRRA